MKRFWIIAGVVLFLIIAFSLCTFQLGENESAAILRFGKIIAVYVKTQPQADQIIADFSTQENKLGDVKVYVGTGLRLRLPFIDSVNKYNNMLLTYDTSPRQVITADKKN